jgi:hypothetical protein
VSSLPLLEIISIAAFLFYGAACLFSSQLVEEFERYGLARYRVLVGLLEIAGSGGLMAGQFYPPLKMAAAGGLVALMLCGVWARWRIRDPWYKLVPALALGAINLAIVIQAWR